MKKIRQWAILLLLLPTVLLRAQDNPYHLSWPRESALLGGSGAGIGISVMLSKKNPPLTPAQIEALDPSRIPSFDRYSLRHYSLRAKKGSDILLFGSLAVPALLLIDGDIRRETPQTALLVTETLFLNTALTNLTKETALRPRPFVYNAAVPLSDKLHRDARKSFFSGHTSTVAALTFCSASIWTEYHPDSKYLPLVWTTAVALPATTGYLRMRAGKHFFSDVLTGFAVGACTGWLVPRLHRR